jgi:hypothetical protein
MTCGRADRVRVLINTARITYHYYLLRINYRSSVWCDLADGEGGAKTYCIKARRVRLETKVAALRQRVGGREEGPPLPHADP